MRTRAVAWTVTACLVGAAFSVCAPALVAQAADEPDTPSSKEVSPSKSTTPAAPSAVDRTASEPPGSDEDLRPRLDFFVPSVKKLLSELQRSHSGVFFSHIELMLRATLGASADGVDSEQADAILARLAKWPRSQMLFR